MKWLWGILWLSTIQVQAVDIAYGGGATTKDSLFARMKIEDPGPRFMHFPHGHGGGNSGLKLLK